MHNCPWNHRLREAHKTSLVYFMAGSCACLLCESDTNLSIISELCKDTHDAVFHNHKTQKLIISVLRHKQQQLCNKTSRCPWASGLALNHFLSLVLVRLFSYLRSLRPQDVLRTFCQISKWVIQVSQVKNMYIMTSLEGCTKRSGRNPGQIGRASCRERV